MTFSDRSVIISSDIFVTTRIVQNIIDLYPHALTFYYYRGDIDERVLFNVQRFFSIVSLKNDGTRVFYNDHWFIEGIDLAIGPPIQPRDTILSYDPLKRVKVQEIINNIPIPVAKSIKQLIYVGVVDVDVYLGYNTLVRRIQIR